MGCIWVGWLATWTPCPVYANDPFRSLAHGALGADWWLDRKELEDVGLLFGWSSFTGGHFYSDRPFLGGAWNNGTSTIWRCIVCIEQAYVPMSSGQIIATENTSFGPPKGSELEGNIPEHFREIQVGEILFHLARLNGNNILGGIKPAASPW